MKKMSDLKRDTRGISCDATVDAFNYLKSKRRQPGILETPTARYVRVSVDGIRYDYSPTTGAWCPTKQRGRNGPWRQAGSVEEFYRKAVSMSAGKYPPTQSQVDYLRALEMKAGVDAAPEAWDDIAVCGSEIDRLRNYAQRPETPPEKPRFSGEQYKALTFIYEGATNFHTPTLSEVALFMGIGKDAAETLVDSLCEKGFLSRSANYIFVQYGVWKCGAMA